MAAMERWVVLRVTLLRMDHAQISVQAACSAWCLRGKVSQ